MEMLDHRPEVMTDGVQQQLKIKIVENLSKNVQLSSHCHTGVHSVMYFSSSGLCLTAGCNIPGFPPTGDRVSGQLLC